jgi:hypothetical protein
MNRLRRNCKRAAVSLAGLAALSACVVGGPGYGRGGGRVYVGGVYEAPGAAYGGWGPGYRVGPSRGDRRDAPSIPDRPRDH